MLTLLSMLSLAQIALPSPVAPPTVPSIPPSETRTAPRQVVEAQEVRPLPGQLDDVPVFNSNSPELIQSEGILLSTFPGDGMQVPSAHLNYPLQGRFDIFAHHVARGITPDDNRTLYLGILVYNPSRQTVQLDSLQAVTYLSQEAPFLDLPPYVANPLGTVFSGPGSRTMNDVLRGQRQPQWPSSISIPPRRAIMLLNAPIPLRRLTVPANGTWPPGRVIPVPNPTPLPQPEPPNENGPTPGSDNGGGVDPSGTNPSNKAIAEGDTPRVFPLSLDSQGFNFESFEESMPAQPFLMADQRSRPLPSNGRTVMMHLNSNGPIYVASMAMYAPKNPDGNERVPTIYEWQQILQDKGLAGPRDYPPTPPDTRYFSRFFYGRVSGIAQGSQWVAQLTDNRNSEVLTIPDEGERISYAVSTVDHNTFGTGQIQSAPMLDRYPDTAYRAHGNYGIKYDLSLPLHNPTR